MSTLQQINDRIDTRLNNCLCEMKPGYDDSMVGFNEAWDIVRAILKEEIDRDVAMMTPAEFHNGLRILSSIDFHELVQAGAITDDADGETEWASFRANPWRYFITVDDDQADKIWSIVARRSAMTQGNRE